MENLNYRIENGEQLVQSHLIKHQAKNSEYLEGGVYIRAADENRLVIFLKNQNNDIMPYFVLQMDEPIEKSFEAQIANAQLFFFENSLLINSMDLDLNYLFTIPSHSSPAILSQIDIKNEFNGFGLVKQKVSSLLKNKHSEESISTRETIQLYSGLNPGNPGDPIYLSCTCVPDGIPSSCGSGGSGSTSCSVSSGGSTCSVGCGNDYHACCNE